jgi:hypothetical protein
MYKDATKYNNVYHLYDILETRKDTSIKPSSILQIVYTFIDVYTDEKIDETRNIRMYKLEILHSDGTHSGVYTTSSEEWLVNNCRLLKQDPKMFSIETIPTINNGLEDYNVQHR